MSAQEIETAITQLDAKDLSELAAWFEEFRAQVWDEQIAQDVRSGGLDSLVQRAREQFKAGNCRRL